MRMIDNGSTTSLTLLGRLRRDPTDQSAWDAFVQRYGRKIFIWARQWGLQEADAHDVTQNVLLKLAGQMRSFTYQPGGSFRAWLKTVAYHAWCSFLSGRKEVHGQTDALEALNSVAAREDFLRGLEEECDRELLEQAMAHVRLRVQPHTWQAFSLMAIDGLSGAEAGARLGMKVATVFVARSKVQKMLHEEVRRLEDADSPPPDN